MLNFKQKLEEKENEKYINFLSQYFVISRKENDDFRNSFDSSWRKIKSSTNVKTFANDYLGLEVDIKINFNTLQLSKVRAIHWQYKLEKFDNQEVLSIYYKNSKLKYNIQEELEYIIPDNLYNENHGSFFIVGDLNKGVLEQHGIKQL